jgi:hypothetical protein
MMLHCPRIGIEPCSPSVFAERINAIKEFPDTQRTPDEERVDLTILSCIVALGGSAHCSFVPGRGLRMASEVGTLFVDKSNGKVSIVEAQEWACPNCGTVTGDVEHQCSEASH